MNTAGFDRNNLGDGQRLAVKYFCVAVILMLAQMLSGALAGAQFLYPDFLFGVLDFSVNRTVHINAMILWMLYGFIGAVYWLIEEEADHPVVGVWLANVMFWILTAAVAVVVVVYVVVQTGAGDERTLWLIMEGREYIEAPRWADIGIVAVLVAFFYNVAATFTKGRWSGIAGVLTADLVALGALYLAGMFFTPNISVDQYWWWWVVHLWVEATWEIMVGCIVAWGLMNTLGARRTIVTTWLYIEVALVLGSGILGLGHHYFWIGAPEYWLGIGGFFSALEPIPLVAMVVHATYDAGVHRFKSTNHPALAWLIANAFGNFLGAGVWGFMQTLPQINLFTHGTQWSASHAHLAFFGAYATINFAVFYLAVQKWRGNVYMGPGLVGAWRWKSAFVLLNLGVLGMSMAMLVAGYQQSFIERAVEGSTWAAYFEAQRDPAFVLSMWWRQLFGCMTLAGTVLLVWDLVSIGRRESRLSELPEEPDERPLPPVREHSQPAGTA